MDRKKLIAVAKARIVYYEDLLERHKEEMYDEDIDKYLLLLAKAYQQLRTLESEE